MGKSLPAALSVLSVTAKIYKDFGWKGIAVAAVIIRHLRYRRRSL